MAIFDELFEDGVAGPVAIGIGALVLAPRVLPAVGRLLRPIAKGAIKTGMSLYEETYATIAEATGDLVAEARSELESESRHQASSRRSRGPEQHAEAT